MTPLAAVREKRDAATVARIVEAARRCFARDGVARTRMGAVAAEAGMARPTMYKAIASREELLEFVLVERCRELLPVFERTARPARRGGGVGEQLVEFLAVMVEVTRDDPEFAELAGAMSREQAFGFLSGPSPLRTLVVEGLGPLFDRAQAEGVLRELPREELAGLAQIVMTPLAARRDLDAAGLRQTLRWLACPALLALR